jgi:hypothetical protein
MARAVACAVLAAVLLAAPATPAVPDACKLMGAAIKAKGGLWPVNLTVKDREKTVSPPGVVCTWNDNPSKLDGFYHLSLYFYVASSPATAKANLPKLVTIPKAKPLGGTGADQAFARESTLPGTSTTTSTGWREGRYWGSMLVSGNGENGDLDDAREFLRLFVKRLPR